VRPVREREEARALDLRSVPRPATSGRLSGILETMSTVIDEAIQKAMQAIETMAPKAWELLVRYERIEGWVDLSQVLFTTSVCMLLLVLAWRETHRKMEEPGNGRMIGSDGEALWYKGDLMDEHPLVVIPALMLAVVLLVGLFRLPTAIAHLVSPEVYAAKKLIGR
jgi:hypothetical protein